MCKYLSWVYLHVCGWICMHGGLKQVWKPLELQFCVLWNACLVMWVLGPELQSSCLQKCCLLLSHLSSPLFSYFLKSQSEENLKEFPYFLFGMLACSFKLKFYLGTYYLCGGILNIFQLLTYLIFILTIRLQMHYTHPHTEWELTKVTKLINCKTYLFQVKQSGWKSILITITKTNYS